MEKRINLLGLTLHIKRVIRPKFYFRVDRRPYAHLNDDFTISECDGFANLIFFGWYFALTNYGKTHEGKTPRNCKI